MEWNADPAYNTGASSSAVGLFYVMRIAAQTGGTISNIVVDVSTLGSGFTAATTATISNVVNNGSGLCRVTATAHGFSTNDVITNAGIVGATEANAASVITVIDANTFDMTQTFTSAYVSGGTATRSANCAALYSSTGAFLTATGDQVGVWNTASLKVMPLVSTVSIAAGSTFYIAFLFNGTAATLAFRTLGQTATANANLTGANIRAATNGSGLTKLPASFASGSNIGAALMMWCALS